ncbi:growth/differentiation factor 8-like [Antedon mediterranea]|uniref:growth/differentiation factor 8-like n=1 Tax=Antedon mediterranea TaxID=105859 RepID=UPI003AF527C9
MVAILNPRVCLIVALVSFTLCKLSALPTTSSLASLQIQSSIDYEEFNQQTFQEEKCTKCVKETEGKLLSKEEAVLLRIELFKMNLLQKMNLKEPPNVSKLPHDFPKSQLSKFMTSTCEDIAEDHPKTDSKTIERATILANKISSDLIIGASSSSLTFNIKRSTLRSYSELGQTYAWIFIKPDALPGVSNIRVSMDIDGTFYYVDGSYLPTSGDWVSVKLTDLMRQWVRQLNDSLESITETLEYTVHIDVPTSAIGIIEDERPMLIISGSQLVKKRVSRNALTCSGDSRQQCCVQSLTVSFNDIGWGHWIVQPDSFTVNYCRGHCDDSNDAIYNSTLALMGYNRQTNSLLVNQCCVPSVLRPLKVIYLSDVTNPTGTPVVSEMTMNDMIIDECGCM